MAGYIIATVVAVAWLIAFALPPKPHKGTKRNYR